MILDGFDFNDNLQYDLLVGDYIVIAGEGDDVVTSESLTLETQFVTTVLVGEEDKNKLIGRHGDDLIDGGYDNNYLAGLAGNDSLYGGSGNDRILGNNGFDRLYGGSGNDTLNGGNGFDRLFGGSGNDLLHGGADRDHLAGNQGNDTLYGGEGDDTYILTSGNFNDLDYLNLREKVAAPDTIAFRASNDTPIFAEVTGFEAEDRVSIELREGVVDNGHFVIDNGVGDALLYIGHGGTLSVIAFKDLDSEFVEDRIS